MQKSLLLIAFAAFALTASAQKPAVKVSKNIKTIEAVGLRSKADLHKDVRKAHRLTQETPTAYMYRDDGIFWLGMNYQGNAGGAYGLAAPGVDITFYADVTGESSKWNYVSAVSEDGNGFTYSEKTITQADSTLTMNFESAYVPNPVLTSSSQVGTSRLNAKTVTDTAAALFAGIQFGGGTYGYFSETDATTGEVVYYDFPICNYSVADYAGSGTGAAYLTVNDATSAANLGNAYKVSNMTIKSAAEYFVNTTGAPMYITGGDAWIYSTAGAPSSENFVAEILSEEDLSVLGTLRIATSETINSKDGSLYAYGLHFTADKAIEAKGSVLLNVRPAEGSDYSFVPRICVVTDQGDGNYGYVIADFTYNDADYEDQFLGNDLFTWGDDSLHASGWIMGLTMSFSKSEADAVLGINGVNNAVKSDVVYDLQGRRVAKAEKGIYVVNGQKVIK